MATFDSSELKSTVGCNHWATGDAAATAAHDLQANLQGATIAYAFFIVFSHADVRWRRTQFLMRCLKDSGGSLLGVFNNNN